MFKKDIAVSILGQFVMVVALMIASGALAKYLGVSNRGVYALAMWWPGFWAMIFPFGLTQVVMIFSGKYPKKRNELFFLIILVGVYSTLLSVLFYNTFNSLPDDIVGSYSSLNNEIFLLLQVLTPLMVINNLLRELGRGAMKIMQTVIIQATGAVMALILVYLVGSLFVMSVELAIGLAIIVNFITLLGYLWVIWGCCNLTIAAIDWNFIKRAFIAGGGYLLNSIAITLCITSPVFVAALLGASNEEIGIMSVALTISQQADLIPTKIAQVFLVYASSKGERVTNRTGEIFRATLVISVPAVIALGVGTSLFVNWLYGADYKDVVSLVYILLFGVLVSSGGRVLTSHLSAILMPKYEMFVTWLRAILQMAMIVMLYPSFGILGAVSAITFSRVARMIALAVVYKKITGCVLKEFIPGIEDVKLFYKPFLNKATLV